MAEIADQTQREIVLDLLEKRAEPVKRAEIIAALDTSGNATSQVLKKLTLEGLVEKGKKHGTYQLAQLDSTSRPKSPKRQPDATQPGRVDARPTLPRASLDAMRPETIMLFTHSDGSPWYAIDLHVRAVNPVIMESAGMELVTQSETAPQRDGEREVGHKQDVG